MGTDIDCQEVQASGSQMPKFTLGRPQKDHLVKLEFFFFICLLISLLTIFFLHMTSSFWVPSYSTFISRWSRSCLEPRKTHVFKKLLEIGVPAAIKAVKVTGGRIHC